jgi:Putative beta barrel porin-7 (BBP7)
MRTVQLLACLALACGAGAVLGQEGAASLVAPPLMPHAVPETISGPDACGCASDCARARVWAEADYVVYWLKPVCLVVPTIATAVPGQSNLQLAQGEHKFEFDGAQGIRPRLGAWLTEDQFLGVEVEGFVLEQVAAGSPVVTTNGSPATFLVFQNPDNTKGQLPFSIAGVVAASSSAVGTSRLWGVESNLAAHFSTQRGSCTLQATALAGFRYLQLDDRDMLSNRQSLVSDPSVTAVGAANFTTRNQFIGGQIGSRLGVARGSLSLDLTTKLAFGETHLVSEVAGSPLISGTSVLPPLVPGPLVALPSNVGRSASDRITVVPEFNLRLRWQLGDHAYLTLGYNLLYWNKILCPGDQMDPHVNTTQLPFRGPVVGPVAPVPQFVFTDAFAHGLEAGFGFSF